MIISKRAKVKSPEERKSMKETIFASNFYLLPLKILQQEKT